VPNRVIGEDQLRAELEAMFDKENPAEQVRASGALYERLGLLPAGSDLRALVLELLGTQVAGFYDPETKVFTLISRGEPFGPADRIIVAHEYAHALQDMKFDLSSTEIGDIAEGDRALARTALIEGDATLLMSVWALQNLTPQELGEVQGSTDPEQQAVLDRMPLLLRRQLLFPYVEGTTFAQQRFMASGGFAGIDATFGKLPESTEQILHPDKYAAGEAPVAIQPADVSASIGEGWKLSYQETFGELGTQVWAATASRRPRASPASRRRSNRSRAAWPRPAGPATGRSATTDRTVPGPWCGRRHGTTSSRRRSS
jgi:hypothetical protein